MKIEVIPTNGPKAVLYRGKVSGDLYLVTDTGVVNLTENHLTSLKPDDVTLDYECYIPLPAGTKVVLTA